MGDKMDKDVGRILKDYVLVTQLEDLEEELDQIDEELERLEFELPMIDDPQDRLMALSERRSLWKAQQLAGAEMTQVLYVLDPSRFRPVIG